MGASFWNVTCMTGSPSGGSMVSGLTFAVLRIPYRRSPKRRTNSCGSSASPTLTTNSAPSVAGLRPDRPRVARTPHRRPSTAHRDGRRRRPKCAGRTAPRRQRRPQSRSVHALLPPDAVDPRVAEPGDVVYPLLRALPLRPAQDGRGVPGASWDSTLRKPRPHRDRCAWQPSGRTAVPTTSPSRLPGHRVRCRRDGRLPPSSSAGRRCC